ncbi:MAG: hypothetical protein KKF44_05900 [Nanoarchaeota archaeon]|nr:hypothetical protein [Nanoarchaeota archaeon]
MTKSIKDITIEDIHVLFDSIIFIRGQEYFEEDFVKSIEALDSSNLFFIEAIIRGKESVSARYC